MILLSSSSFDFIRLLTYIEICCIQNSFFGRIFHLKTRRVDCELVQVIMEKSYAQKCVVWFNDKIFRRQRTSPTTKHHLLRLPAELRLMIWDFVFSPEKLITLNLINSDRKNRPDLANPLLNYPKWTPLQICRQIRDEGLEFYNPRQTSFSIDLIDLPQFLKFLEHPHFQARKYLKSLVIRIALIDGYEVAYKQACGPNNPAREQARYVEIGDQLQMLEDKHALTDVTIVVKTYSLKSELVADWSMTTRNSVITGIRWRAAGATSDTVEPDNGAHQYWTDSSKSFHGNGWWLVYALAKSKITFRTAGFIA